MLSDLFGFFIYFMFILGVTWLYGGTFNLAVIIFSFWFFSTLSALVLHKIKFEPGLFFAIIITFHFSFVLSLILGSIFIVLCTHNLSKILYYDSSTNERKNNTVISFMICIFTTIIFAKILPKFQNFFIYQILTSLFFVLMILTLPLIELNLRKIKRDNIISIYRQVLNSIMILVITTTILFFLFGNKINSFLI